ncbi:MAG: DUF2961 domain-containing protein [Bacteroidales bacterium]|nr:DUF2961 domain-containing protein [Bacteroidales bacterium]
MNIFKFLTITFLLSSISVFAQKNNSGSALDNLIYKQDFKAQRESSSNENLHKNGDAVSIEPGETIVLGDLSGPGIINHIWITIGSEDPFFGRSLVIRMYWDGSDKPSVEAPLGDFFGVGHGAFVSFESNPVSTSSHGRAKNCFWKMPFRNNAKVTITNESKEYRTDSFYYYLDWEKHDSLPEDVLYFHAQYRQQFPAQTGDYTILETEGFGHYVGTIYSVQNMELGWFGEGDDRFYIDGEEIPSLRGTGTEDYFGDAWGFRQFDRPYYGVSLWEGYFPGDRVTAYRWHIPDPIPFRKSIKVTIEHRGSIFSDLGIQLGSFIERPDWISSVAIWYQSTPAQFEESIPPANKRIAPYQIFAAKNLTIRANPENCIKKADISLDFIPMKPDAYLEFDFNVEKDGRYQINVILMHSLFSSKYQPFLDGKALGPELDLYTSGNDPIWEHLDLHDLSTGTHTLRFEGKGASPKMRTMAPPTYYFSMVYLILLRLEDMEGYHNAYNELAK